jgi:hypothetical protein
LKVKALRGNIGFNGKEAGSILEVSEETGKHLIEKGFAEEYKTAPKKPAPKKTTKKTTEK